MDRMSDADIRKMERRHLADENVTLRRDLRAARRELRVWRAIWPLWPISIAVAIAVTFGLARP